MSKTQKQGKAGTAAETKTPFNTAPATEGATPDPVAAAQAADQAALDGAQAGEGAGEEGKTTGEGEGVGAQGAASADAAAAGVAASGAAETSAVAAAPAVQVAQPVVLEKTTEAVAVATKQVVSVQPIRNNTTSAPQLRAETPTVAAPAVDAAVTASGEFRTLMDKERKTGTANAVALVNFLEEYVENMAPRRPISDDDLLKFQEALHARLKDTLERAPVVEFPRLWNIFTAYVREFKDRAFSPRYSHRGIKEWRRDPDEFSVLSGLLNLVFTAVTSDSTVARDQRVSLEKSLKTGLSDDARGRLTSFYRR